jgi:hypothetical protein
MPRYLDQMNAKEKPARGEPRTGLLVLACRLWFLEEEPGSEHCRCAVFGGAVDQGVLTPVDFPAHAHLLDRLPHHVGRDLVQLVFVGSISLNGQSVDVAKLCVEGRGFGQAERQTDGEGDCFKRITS